MTQQKPHKPLIIALTGGIASGKTTVANLFHEQFGIDLIDADVIARQVVEPNSEGLTKIIAHFGSQILTQQGELDRAALRERIFANPDEKQWLNQLLHPLIRQQMQRQIQQVQSPYGLLVVPLLVENNLQAMADQVIVVDVSPQTQIERTMQRDNVSQQQVESILAAQASRQQRLAIADDVIINDLQLNNQIKPQLMPQVTNLHKKYLTMTKNQ